MAGFLTLLLSYSLINVFDAIAVAFWTAFAFNPEELKAHNPELYKLLSMRSDQIKIRTKVTVRSSSRPDVFLEIQEPLDVALHTPVVSPDLLPIAKRWNLHVIRHELSPQGFHTSQVIEAATKAVESISTNAKED